MIPFSTLHSHLQDRGNKLELKVEISFLYFISLHIIESQTVLQHHRDLIIKIPVFTKKKSGIMKNHTDVYMKVFCLKVLRYKKSHFAIISLCDQWFQLISHPSIC